MQGLLRRILALWVRATLRPEDAAARLKGRTVPICYVLERVSSSDLAVLQNVCVRERLPGPGRRLLARQLRNARSSLALTRSVGFWRSRDDRRPPRIAAEADRALRQDPMLDVSLVPAAVYWGRAPSRERSLIRLLLSEDWVIASRVRRAFTVLFNGRNTTVQLGDPVSLRSLLESGVDTALSARRVSRLLRQQLSRLRTARIGPDLSHRRTIVAEVLRTRAVRAAVAQEVRTKARAPACHIARSAEICERDRCELFARIREPARDRAGKAVEPTVRRRGVRAPRYAAAGRTGQRDRLCAVSPQPHGLSAALVCHLPAGLRGAAHCGRTEPESADRRTVPAQGRRVLPAAQLRGSTLYTVVFMKYLAAMMARGHSLEYFIEGGRSRTGRLRPPMTGMLSMTVRSYLREPRRPVVFVPVYFGYERIVEGATYIGELSGRPKEKESVLGLLRAVGKLRQRFGRVHVNLGEPIHLDALIDRYQAGMAKRGSSKTRIALAVGGRAGGRAGTEHHAANQRRRDGHSDQSAGDGAAGDPRQSMLEADLVRP
jgi:glycerol-3-phosphate O-acyltransferase